ncbi:hypothetical protein MPS01_01530 [Marinilactibacillus psychrotolerans]|uniref:Ribosomal protein L20 n=1 Tax=Marinilactibacillus psychrotolerans TaxID=191770 RepID=A0AAV3WSU7_9LACT|nr:hypothetical protein MPS01_01530 [Marinilactibacillus psychrotolerans]GEQ34726.1 hypothetical protein M132T_02340 [Marinilactibacillus psychrotolerans]
MKRLGKNSFINKGTLHNSLFYKQLTNMNLVNTTLTKSTLVELVLSKRSAYNMFIKLSNK